MNCECIKLLWKVNCFLCIHQLICCCLRLTFPLGFTSSLFVYGPADINVDHIYYGIWQNWDLKNQHQSKGRLFQSSYLYDLPWIPPLFYIYTFYLCCFPLRVFNHVWLSPGARMLCLCTHWFWQNICFCLSDTYETQGTYILALLCLIIIILIRSWKASDSHLSWSAHFKGWCPSCNSFPYKRVSCSDNKRMQKVGQEEVLRQVDD